MGNHSYWVGRAKAEKTRVDKSIEEIATKIREAYDLASHDIDTQVAAWYQRFADDNGVSLAAARRTLNAGELKDFKMTLKEYIKHGEQLDSDRSWLGAMKNASTKHHIDRLTALQMTTRAEIQEALAKWTSAAIPKMDDILTESFLRYNFYVQKDIGVGKYINGADIQKLRVAANKPWTPDGIEFKKRAGVNNAKLVSALQRELMQSCITGRPYEQLAENLRKIINLSEYESERLIRTESTHLATLAERETYDMYGINEYEYLATLDHKTCELCGPLDGQVFKVSDMVEGVNAPPIHPNCRCTTIPHYDNLGGSRAARDEKGKTVFVDGDTTYSEWIKEQKEVIEEKISSPLNKRNNVNGKPTAMITIEGVKLNNKQRKLLNQLKDYDSRIVVKKNEVSLKDLSALTAETENEFAMFTKSGKRLIIRGNETNVNVTVKDAEKLKKEGYKFSGHTHPGIDKNCLIASVGDKEILKAFEQEISVIYNSIGRYMIFGSE